MLGKINRAWFMNAANYLFIALSLDSKGFKMNVKFNTKRKRLNCSAGYVIHSKATRPGETLQIVFY